MTHYENFRDGLTGELTWMRVENGRITARGTGPAPEKGADLGGKTVLPKFIDAHCHILPTGLMLTSVDLAGVDSHEEVLERVLARHRELEPGVWLHASYYDQTRFPGGEHLTRQQLDAISSERPILLRHVNGHASVANTAVLRLAGLLESTAEDPEVPRGEDGLPVGVLFEGAHERASKQAPTPTLEQMVAAILAAGRSMAALGIGTATDMMTGRYHLRRELEAYRLAAEQGNPIRVRLCLQWKEVFGPKAEAFDDLVAAMDPATCKVWGIKIFADGAIGSATAAIYGRYEHDDTDGLLIYPPDRLSEMVRIAHEAGYPVAIHTIGDRATDHVMDAYAALDEPARHRIEHAMILSDAQIERMAQLGVHCTMQPEFLHRFGHSYRRQLGPERMSRLKRARSVIDAGIPLSFNSDRPIVPGEPWIGIEAATNRPEGFDPAENVTRAEAIRAYTEMGAHANDDQGELGTLAVGEWADFQVIAP